VEVGDLVSYEPSGAFRQRWVVTSYERIAKVVTLIGQDGAKIEIPVEANVTDPTNPQVICHPPKVWQLLTAPVRSAAGPFVKMVIPAILRRPEIVLEQWVDWIQSDIFREGGSFFVNPDLRLRQGVLILATHKNGHSVRITVPSTLGTSASRKAAKTATIKPKEEFNRFNRILRDDDD
jgi:hypothetical protein